ncbi:radical SAM protein [Candidatus Magnetominusculus xianensis]|uniref:Radical SAM protein n=1 Tax=Candidatus Magnetominusculus xianensis TaxID=1748249 RepID=A0ABR5SE03_9BACT|nr:radical SAM protein [Candidatus Magnetominusculus xianensis]
MGNVTTERRRYNSFGLHMRERFGQSVYKVNIDAGFTCPNRDGTVGVGGCVYCNNDSFRPSSCKPALGVRQQVENGISYLSKRYKANKFIAYFQPYTNTYAPVDELRRIYHEALAHPGVVGIAVGTRPDAIDDEKFALLESIAKDYFVLIEFGLQSIYDKSLAYINRGHDYACFINAIDMAANYNLLHIGAHIIAGFPTETIAEMLSMAGVISGLRLGFLKIHQLQVVKGTAMAAEYARNPFFVFEYEQYLDFLVEFVERLTPGVVLQRMFATAPDDILIAPVWNKTRQQILIDIDNKFKQLNTYQGRNYKC